MAVSTGRLLWLLPLATAACAGAHWAAGAASQLALPWYRELPAERQALWRVDLTHLAYSCVTGAGRGGDGVKRAALKGTLHDCSLPTTSHPVAFHPPNRSCLAH